MKILLAFFISSVIFLSCSTVRPHKEKLNEQIETNNNPEKINGIYSNLEKGDTLIGGTSEVFSLWDKLFARTDPINNWQKAKVKLLTNHNRLTATLMIDSTIVEERTIKFKTTKGYFNLKRQFSYGFYFGPLVWAIADCKVYVGVTKDKNLVVINSSNGSTMVVILPIFFAGDQSGWQYDRVN